MLWTRFKLFLYKNTLFLQKTQSLGLNDLLRGKIGTLKATKLKSLKRKGLSSFITFISSSIQQSSKVSLNHGLKVSLFIFLKVRIKTNPINYKIIMISHLLATFYGIIVEKKIYIWLESQEKRSMNHFGFRIYHSTIDHLAMIRIIS